MEQEIPDVNELMTKMRKINPKYLNETLSEIFQLEKMTNVSINIPKISLKDCPANIRKTEKHYFIEFEEINSYDKEFRDIFEIEIKTQNGLLYKGLDGVFVKRHDQIEKFNFRFTIKINLIVKGAINENIYHRMVIPAQRDVTIMVPFFCTCTKLFI
jgi:hypothetical protein